MYTVKGNSMKDNKEQILCQCGCGKLRDRFDKRGIERHYIRGHYNRGRPISEAQKLKISNTKIRGGANVGEKHYNWKGDNVPDKRFRERARDIYQRHHKVTLPTGVHVHHIDLNPKNNDIENLVTMTKSDHSSLHSKLNREIYSKFMINRWKNMTPEQKTQQIKRMNDARKWT